MGAETGNVKREHAIESRVDGLLRYLTASGEVHALGLAGELAAAATLSGGFVPISSRASARAIGWQTIEPTIAMESNAVNIGAET